MAERGKIRDDQRGGVVGVLQRASQPSAKGRRLCGAGAAGDRLYLADGGTVLAALSQHGKKTGIAFGLHDRSGGDAVRCFVGDKERQGFREIRAHGSAAAARTDGDFGDFGDFGGGPRDLNPRLGTDEISTRARKRLQSAAGSVKTSSVQPLQARMAKLVDAPDLGSGGAIRAGSSPVPGIL